ncbi:hypothetical protein D3C71_1384150 [compost metagenome]
MNVPDSPLAPKVFVTVPFTLIISEIPFNVEARTGQARWLTFVTVRENALPTAPPPSAAGAIVIVPFEPMPVPPRRCATVFPVTLKTVESRSDGARFCALSISE